MEQPRSHERLRELIDEALDEIERTELEMLDLLADVLGPRQAARVADEMTARSVGSPFGRLPGAGLSTELSTDPSRVDRARSGQPSTDRAPGPTVEG